MKHKTKFLLIFFVLSLAAFMLRFVFFPFLNGDLTNYVVPWYEFIQSQGGFAALKYNFSNYSPAYPTLLVFATYIRSLPAVITIKLLSIFQDYLLALIAGQIIFVLTQSKMKQLIMMIIVLFTPVVFIDSAYWGQCDAIYTFWILVSFYFLITERPIWAVIAFGLSFAFKFQAIFFGPILFIYFLRNKKNLFYFLFIPLIYVITALPTLFSGRPFWDILLVYLHQANYYKALTMSAPNIYVFLSNNHYEFFVFLGFILSILIFCIFMALIYCYKNSITPTFWLVASAFIMFLVPMVLPKMHERYVYPAVIFSLLLVVVQRDMLFYAVMLQITNLFSYLGHLLGGVIISMQVLAVINILLLLVFGIKLLKQYGFSENLNLKFTIPQRKI